MPNPHRNKETWHTYQQLELERAQPLLEKLGFVLEEKQPHIQGERFLMQAVTTESGKKLILIGTRKKDGRRVVIKATSDKEGKEELERDHVRRKILNAIGFAYQIFSSPEEILFIEKEGMVISVQVFIEQSSTFLERPLKEQFNLALASFKAQEGAHMTTYRHQKIAKRYFQTVTSDEYLKWFTDFKKNILAQYNNSAISKNLQEAEKFLQENKETIEQYSGFLTHTDFVPHNIRVQDGRIFLLDHSSLRFGNKYEGWARFLNFMALYNPELESALVQYVRNNRAEEELLSLKVMRVYRLTELIWYYARSLEHVSGDLKTLNIKRIEFWNSVLKAVLDDTKVPDEIIENYKNDRDSLRSESEKERQIGLH